jgi:flagellar P-ring protein precursor FlgI
MIVCTLFFIAAFLLFMAGMADAARIKEMGYINGARSNQLIGYGLVTGLSGNGDKSNRSSRTSPWPTCLKPWGSG